LASDKNCENYYIFDECIKVWGLLFMDPPTVLIDTLTRGFKPVDRMREVWVSGKAVRAKDNVL